jgi:hypothetical protein
MKEGWASLREIDERAGKPKGSAFRAFRAIEPQLRDGFDFVVTDDPAQLAALKVSGRIYASSVKLILLAPAVAARVTTTLTALPPA